MLELGLGFTTLVLFLHSTFGVDTLFLVSACDNVSRFEQLYRRTRSDTLSLDTLGRCRNGFFPFARRCSARKSVVLLSTALPTGAVSDEFEVPSVGDAGPVSGGLGLSNAVYEIALSDLLHVSIASSVCLFEALDFAVPVEALDFLIFFLVVTCEPTFPAIAAATLLLTCKLRDLTGALPLRLKPCDDFELLMLLLSLLLSTDDSNTDILSLIDAETFELVDRTGSLDVRWKVGLAATRFLVLPL